MQPLPGERIRQGPPDAPDPSWGGDRLYVLVLVAFIVIVCIAPVLALILRDLRHSWKGEKRGARNARHHWK